MTSKGRSNKHSTFRGQPQCDHTALDSALPVCLGCKPTVRLGPERGLLVAKQTHLGTTQACDAGTDECNGSKAVDMVCA